MNLYKAFNHFVYRSTENPDFSREDRTRFQHYTLFLTVGVPFLVSFGFLNILDGNYVVSFFCAASAIGLSAGWGVIRSTAKGKIVYRINTLLFLFLITCLIIFGGEGGSKILWVYIFPLVCFFLFGKNEGIFWSVISMVLLAVLFFIPINFVTVYGYHHQFKVRFIASYLTVTAITYWLEYFRFHFSEKLAIQNEALNREIAERKEIELERERLIKEVQLASQAKSEFLANMSHEIRTPLNGIIGLTTLLLETSLNNEQKHHVRALKKSGDFLLTIINDILDVSKIEAGKLELARTNFNLRDMLDDFSDIASQKIYNSDVELIVGAAPDTHLELCGDPDRLQQILLNLTSNALKFTKRGTVFVWVEKETETQTDVVLRFSVKDTGIGIAESDRSRLFDSFSQIDGSTTREHGGTGLGLSIAKQLAEQFDGEIGVESTLGEGSEFWFTARFEKDISAKAGPDNVLPCLKDKRVLLVLQNSSVRQVLVEQLGYWGAYVEQAANVKDARKIFDTHSVANELIDIFVVDQAFLTGSYAGFNTIIGRHIKDTGSQLIILSNHRVNRVFSSGFVTNEIIVLEKPFKYRDLERCFSGEGKETKLPGIVTEKTLLDPQDRERFTILIAEDNVINQQVMTGILSRLGYKHVDTANNGLDVLTALENKHYDLILMDVSMPKMDGLTTTREIRSGSYDLNSNTLPVIALTAHVIVGDREKCIAAGMDDYLTKPVNPQVLETALDQWLGVVGQSDGQNRQAMKDSSAGAEQVPARFDYDTTLNRVMGDTELIQEVLTIFIEDMPEQLNSLRTAIHEWSLPKVEELSHKLAGASANVGADMFSAVARRIEMQCKEKNVNQADIENMYTELEAEFQLVRAEMAKYL